MQIRAVRNIRPFVRTWPWQRHDCRQNERGCRLSAKLIGHRGDEAVTTPWQRFNVAGLFWVVSKHHTYLVHARVDTSLEVHERVLAPQRSPDFLARHNLFGASCKQLQHLKGLRVYFQRDAGFPQLAASGVQFELAEAHYCWRMGWRSHHIVPVSKEIGGIVLPLYSTDEIYLEPAQ